MATLNQAETDALFNAISVLEGVLREGFIPDKEGQESPKHKQIVKAKEQIHTVVVIKGYYPS